MGNDPEYTPDTKYSDYIIVGLLNRIAELEAECDMLAVLFIKYGRHLPACETFRPPHWKKKICTCGFDEAIKAKARLQQR